MRTRWLLLVSLFVGWSCGGGAAPLSSDAAPASSDAAPIASDAAAGPPMDAGTSDTSDTPDAPAMSQPTPWDGGGLPSGAGSAVRLYGLQLGARWTYKRSGGMLDRRWAGSAVTNLQGDLRWKEITACETVPLFDDDGRVQRAVRAHVRENRGVLGTTSVHYLVADDHGVQRIRRDDIDEGNLTMAAIYAPPSLRLANDASAVGRQWQFALRTAEFEWPAGGNPRLPRFRGADNTSAVDVVKSLDWRSVVAGLFPTVGIDRQWAANNAHNVHSYYSPGVGEIVEVTIWPASPLPIIQVEELVAFTPGYGSCDGSTPMGAAPCNPPLLVCDRPWGSETRGCTDPRVDPANCGSCGTTCPSGVCAAGVCQVSQCSVSCGGSTICCPNAWRWSAAGCTNPARDRWNCGGCGVVCSSDRICDRGVCTCAPGKRDCGGGCQDVLKDPRNCGECGNACGQGAPKCDMGVCYSSCGSLDLFECGGKCVDPEWDDNNCGGCGRKCGPGTGTLQCRLGQCVPCAMAGYGDCGGTCYDLAWSREHCGACNRACPLGQVCAFGKCITGDGSGLCRDPDKISCRGNCINPRTSDSNCGGCGVAVCAGGCTEACRQGICSLVDCGGGDD